MNHSVLVFGATLLAAGSLCADGWTLLDGGWRISAGAVYNSPVKTRLSIAPMSAGRPAISSGISGKTRAEAEAEAKGMKHGTRTDYGSGAWFDSDSSLGDENWTWNGQIPNARSRLSSDNQTFLLDSVGYSDSVTTYESLDTGRFRDTDEAAMPGLNIELSRNLYHDEEYDFGLDLAFGVSYFFRHDVFSAGGSYQTGRSTTTTDGRYETTIDAPDGPYVDIIPVDAWQWNDDGSYGAGSYSGFPGGLGGPVFDLGSISTTHHPGQSASHQQTYGGSCRVRGTYRELEMMLCVRPYYDLTDWFRLYGTLGIAVSRADLDLRMSFDGNGASDTRKRNFNDWDVYGVAGLGGMLRYKNFTLGADFLARFLDDDLSVNDKYVKGSLERGNWMFRLSLGYEF